jgi:hypothetical protein
LVVKAEALPWLLEDSNPAVRCLTLTDILAKGPDDAEVRTARKSLLAYGPVQALKKSQNTKGYWPPDDGCYNPKFTSTVWQLMLLGEMGVPRTSWVERATERFLSQHQMDNGAFCCPTLGIDKGDIDEEPCLTGNMIRTLLVFGYGDDTRVRRALDWLPESQFKDGGWNCDHPDVKFENGRLNWSRARDDPTHSSFMSTVEPLWAYSEVPRARWTKKMKGSIERGAEFLLAHRVYKSHRDGSPVKLRDLEKFYAGDLVTMFHFPEYYYYDALHGLRVLAKLGYGDDERVRDAVDLVLSKKGPDGKWLLEGDWVRERKDKSRKTRVTLERIDRPSKWITLNCYRALTKTGDLELPN